VRARLRPKDIIGLPPRSPIRRQAKTMTRPNSTSGPIVSSKPSQGAGGSATVKVTLAIAAGLTPKFVSTFRIESRPA
jgi:hypothetical protein